jgi:hypothetical protein
MDEFLLAVADNAGSSNWMANWVWQPES